MADVKLSQLAAQSPATLGELHELVPTPTMKNLLINGDFAINQRVFGGGALAAGVYGFDRWKAGTGGCNVSLSGDVLTHTSGPLVQAIELPNLAGREVTISVEDPSGSVSVDVDGAAGVIASGVGRQGVTLTVPGGSTGNVTLTLTATGVTYKRVQMELGPTHTSYDARNPGLELVLCQRYYQKTYKQGVAPGSASVNGEVMLVWMGGTVGAAQSFLLGTRMRIAPAVSFYDRAGNAGVVSVDAADNIDITSGAIYAADNMVTADFNAAVSGNRARFHVVLNAEL